jgi:hypothetical protein
MSRRCMSVVGARADVICISPFDPSTDIGSSYISARSPQSVNRAQSAAPKRAQTKQSRNLQKQIISRHGRVPQNDTASIAQLLGGAISARVCVSKSCYGELMILVRRHDVLRTLDGQIGSSSW